MSDYNPNPNPDPRRPDDNPNFAPASPSRTLYLVLGVVAALVVVVGLMFFTSTPNEMDEQAQQPDRTIDSPATNDTRTPTLPPKPMPPPTTPQAPKPQE